MKFNTFIKVFLAAQGILSQTLQAVPQRPSFSSFPKHLGRSWWEDSPPRDPRKLCIVPHGEIDDAPGILKSIKACNNGGTVVFLPSVTYIVASPLDLTFLKNIDIAILGKIVLKDDVEYWQTHFFAYSFQGAVTFWRFGGEDVNIFGLGVGEIDGNYGAVPQPAMMSNVRSQVKVRHGGQRRA